MNMYNNEADVVFKFYAVEDYPTRIFPPTP